MELTQAFARVRSRALIANTDEHHFKVSKVHDVSLPGGSARARSQGVNDVIQIVTTSQCARLKERVRIEEDQLDDGDGQRRQARLDSWS